MKPTFDRYRHLQLGKLILAIVISLLLIPGVSKLRFDVELKNIFRFDSAEYQDYQEMLQVFPEIESDFVLIIPGEVFTVEKFSRVLALVDALSLLSDISYVVSMASIPAVENLITDPVSLELLPEINADLIKQLKAQRQTDPVPYGYLISPEADAQLIVVRAKSGLINDSIKLKGLKIKIDHLATSNFGDDAAKFLMGGAPAMKVALNNQVTSDTVKINVIAMLLATIVAALLFRSLRILLVISLGPALGTLWTLGIMASLGDKITVFTSILVPLLFVIGYANAAHIIFRILGSDKSVCRWRGSWQAMTAVVRACFISAITTAVGFASLCLSGSELVAEFGFYCAVGSILIFVSVVLLTPGLSALLQIRDKSNVEPIIQPAAVQLGNLGRWVTDNNSIIIRTGVIISIVIAITSFQVVPDYRFKENFSPSKGFYKAVEMGDSKFSGLLSANVVINWGGQHGFDSATLFEIEDRVSDLAIEIFETNRIISLAGLYAGSRRSQIGSLNDLQLQLPELIGARFINFKQQHSLVTIPLPDQGARKLIPKLDNFRTGLDSLSNQYPGVSLLLSGIVPVTMYGSVQNINEMAQSLGLAIVIIFFVIALLLRSLKLGLICMFPNIVPIAGVASLLVLTDTSLQYNSVLVFTICLGIAVDDTVHFILRYRSEFLRSGNARQAVVQTIQQIGLVLIFTTAILGAGFVSLMFSSVAVVSFMGLLSCIALGLALLADLVFLPALLSSRFSLDALDK